MARRKPRKEWRYLADTPPRTAARLLGISRRQARALIRLERAWLFDDLIGIVPGGVGMRDATFVALTKIKGSGWLEQIGIGHSQVDTPEKEGGHAGQGDLP